MLFALLWVQHGGSGVPGIAYDQLMELSLDEIEWFADRVETQRTLEAQAIRKGK